MSAEDKVDGNLDSGIALRSDPANLIEALYENIRLKTGEINSMADAEIKSIEDEASRVVEKFRDAEKKK